MFIVFDHRPIHPDLKILKNLKLEMFEKRLQLVKMNKSDPWDIETLRYVLKSLKKHKSRDPHNLINEPFRPEIIGSDLEYSLLLLLNKVRQTFIIPDFMEFQTLSLFIRGEEEKIP